MNREADDPEDAEDDNPSQELLGFFMEDRHFLVDLKQAVRKLLCRKSTTPEQIYHLAKLLLVLDRFPRPTKGIAIELVLSREHANGESTYLELFVDETTFRAGEGARVIVDSSAGADNTSETILEVETGGFRELLHPTAFAVWVEQFVGRANERDQKLDISDMENGSEIDWETQADESDWEKLGSDYV